MKFSKARRRFKLWAVASFCLVVILACCWLAAHRGSNRLISRASGGQLRGWRPKWGQYEEIDHGANESQALIYYEPEAIYDENFVERLKVENRLIKSKHSPRYSMRPRNNVIECHQSARLDSGEPSSSEPAKFQTQTTLFIVVNSRVDNFERRDKLRRSWLNRWSLEREICSSYGTPIKRIVWTFAVGQANGHPDDLRLREESELHGDLLMLAVGESYRNLTQKHLAIFEWLLEQRRDSAPAGRELLLKCDDDAQLDLGQLIEMYSSEGLTPADSRQDLLMCARFRDHSRVLRREANVQTTKWSLTRQEWPYDTFPAYCSGLAYLAGLDLVEKLFLVSKLMGERSQMKTLWIDDVYVTGVLLAALKLNDLKLVKLNSVFCFTEAQRQHRESLGTAMRCLATEETN